MVLEAALWIVSWRSSCLMVSLTSWASPASWWRIYLCSSCFHVQTCFFFAVFIVDALPEGQTRTAGPKKMQKSQLAPKRRTAAVPDRKDEPAGQAWLPVVLPGGESWGKRSRSYDDIIEALKPPEGPEHMKRRKSASFQRVPPSAYRSKSERKRQQA